MIEELQTEVTLIKNTSFDPLLSSVDTEPKDALVQVTIHTYMGPDLI